MNFRGKVAGAAGAPALLSLCALKSTDILYSLTTTKKKKTSPTHAQVTKTPFLHLPTLPNIGPHRGLKPASPANELHHGAATVRVQRPPHFFFLVSVHRPRLSISASRPLSPPDLSKALSIGCVGFEKKKLLMTFFFRKPMTFLFGSRSEKMQTFEKSSMKEFKRFPQSILEIHRVDVVHTDPINHHKNQHSSSFFSNEFLHRKRLHIWYRRTLPSGCL